MARAKQDSGADSQASQTAALSVLASQIEAMLFLATSPVRENEMRDVLGVSNSELSRALSELEQHLSHGHGLILKALAGGWVLATNPHFAEVLARFRDTAQKSRVRLSRAAVETAAVIAWNQPVTRSEVEDLRGVRSERVIETLLNHGLVKISGRKKMSGSPLLYRTTPKFLEVFGLEAIADLPSLEELGELGADPVAAASANITRRKSDESKESLAGVLSDPDFDVKLEQSNQQDQELEQADVTQADTEGE